MGILAWTWIIVGMSFALYIGIAIWSKAKTTGEFYVAADIQSAPVAIPFSTGWTCFAAT
jgi:cation/acetate symporter